jgi:hypothetical protein
MRVCLIALLVCFSLVSPANALDQIQAEAGSSEVLQQDCESRVADFLASKGWTEGSNFGGQLMVAAGTAAIRAEPGQKGYPLARKLAFSRALLDAKKHMAEYLKVTISRVVAESIVEPDMSESWRQVEAAHAEATKSVELSLYDKSMMILHNELDRELASRDIAVDDPEMKEEVEEQLSIVLAESRYSDVITSMAQNEVAGLTAFKTYECQPSDGQGEVYVVCLFSEKTRHMASALLGRNQGPVRGEVGEKPPLLDQLPDANMLVCTYGVQQRIDESGNVTLLSFGHGIPRTTSRESMKTARRKAQLTADGEIRSYAGELVAVNSVADQAETFREMEDALGVQSSIYESTDSFNEATSTVAEELDISGITTLWAGEVSNPITGEKSYLVVRQWSPVSSGRANVLRNALNSMTGSSGGSGLTKVLPQETDQGASEDETPGASGTGEGGEGDVDGIM